MLRFRLGWRIVVGCLILVCSPLLVAWGMGIYDRVEVDRIRGELEVVGREARRAARQYPGERLLDEAGRAWLIRFGRKHDVFIRVLDASGGIEEETDARYGDGRISHRWWFSRSADLFFGPEGPPDLIGFEASVGPEATRTEVRDALRTRRPTHAYRAPDLGNMFVFYRAIPIDDGRVLYLTRVSRRSARALYDLRYQLLKLTLGLALGALAMGAWLAWGVVGPLRGLQRRVRRAIATGVWTERPLTRRDEIGQLSRDFDRLARKMMTRLEDTANVASDFAHDLKNPIAAVTASAELLEADRALDPERRARLARSVGHAARHMQRSVDAMLELARLDEGLEKEPRSDVAFDEIVRSVVADFEADDRYASLDFETDLAPTTIFGNAPRLEELVRNLVDNATVFAKRRVRVALHHGEETARLSVADDGPGVSDGNRDKIFGRFFSARPEDAVPGSGLGLAIVESVATAHRGSVALSDSKPIGGAMFVVELTSLVPPD